MDKLETFPDTIKPSIFKRRWWGRYQIWFRGGGTTSICVTSGSSSAVPQGYAHDSLCSDLKGHGNMCTNVYTLKHEHIRCCAGCTALTLFESHCGALHSCCLTSAGTWPVPLVFHVNSYSRTLGALEGKIWTESSKSGLKAPMKRGLLLV